MWMTSVWPNPDLLYWWKHLVGRLPADHDFVLWGSGSTRAIPSLKTHRIAINNVPFWYTGSLCPLTPDTQEVFVSSCNLSSSCSALSSQLLLDSLHVSPNKHSWLVSHLRPSLWSLECCSISACPLGLAIGTCDHTGPHSSPALFLIKEGFTGEFWANKWLNLSYI